MKVSVKLEKATRATGKRFSSTQTCIIIGIIIGIIAILLIVMIPRHREKDFYSDKAGEQVSIGWEEVNLREGPSTSKKVIATLHRGSSVTLTGNSYSFITGSGSPTDSWIEVELKDGTIGWVVVASIKSI